MYLRIILYSYSLCLLVFLFICFKKGATMKKIIYPMTLAVLLNVVNAKEYILSDASEGIDIGNWSITNDELGIDRNFAISQRILHGGKQEGVRVIDINNGTMTITIIPTRGMGIFKVKSDDITLGWQSPVTEIVNPAYINLDSRNGLGWLDGFNEMMVRAGFEWTGHPGKDGDYLLSLHGRSGNTPASKVSVNIADEPPYKITVKGMVYEKTFKFNDYQISANLSVVPGEKSFTVHDELTNLGDYENEYQILYHANFGPPLLEEGAKFFAAIKQLSPFNARAAKEMATWNQYAGPTPGYNETVYNIFPYAKDDGTTLAMLSNKAGNKGVSVGFDINQLPVLTMWKNTDTLKQGYVTGIEPGTSYAYNRQYQRELGLVPKIQPGETKRFNTVYTILDSATSVEAAKKAITAIQGDQPTEVLDKALVKLP